MSVSKEINIFFRWLEIREENGYPRTTTLNQLKADADHSSLLKRLLRGEDPLPEAPPRAYSYPWCGLIRDGKASPFEVSESGMVPGKLVIEQSLWEIIEKLGEDSWIVTYHTPDVSRIRRTPDHVFRDTSKAGYEYLKLSESRWKVYSTGPNPIDPERKAWVIERVSPDTL